ncbi:Ltp family lipoprotein [Acinetobacter baumannii]
MRTAKSYLEYQAFSRKGLINQLSSDYGEGYSVNDATVAVDSLDVDWKEQAAKAAAQYLEQQGFSCKGLINQLASDYGEKFTLEQAKYGAAQAGACS